MEVFDRLLWYYQCKSDGIYQLHVFRLLRYVEATVESSNKACMKETAKYLGLPWLPSNELQGIAQFEGQVFLELHRLVVTHFNPENLVTNRVVDITLYTA